MERRTTRMGQRLICRPDTRQYVVPAPGNHWPWRVSTACTVVEAADTTGRIHDRDQLLTEVPRTTTKPIARFKARNSNAAARASRHNGPMPAADTQLWQLLRSLDDPHRLEFPAGYRHRRPRTGFEQLAQRVDTDLDCHCDVDRNIQDASLHGRIEI